MAVAAFILDIEMQLMRLVRRDKMMVHLLLEFQNINVQQKDPVCLQVVSRVSKLPSKQCSTWNIRYMADFKQYVLLCRSID